MGPYDILTNLPFTIMLIVAMLAIGIVMFRRSLGFRGPGSMTFVVIISIIPFVLILSQFLGHNYMIVDLNNTANWTPQGMYTPAPEIPKTPTYVAPTVLTEKDVWNKRIAEFYNQS